MKFFNSLRSSPPREHAGDRASAEGSPPDEGQLPITGYDKLDPQQLRPHLSLLSQGDLAVIESYEIAHQARPVVLNRVDWLKESEPISGYDDLTAPEIAEALAESDTGTLKAVREYERRHQDRHEVRAEIARVLPTALASSGEDRAREAQATLVRTGIAGREKTGAGLSSRP